jgi:hypothetical protein
VFLVSPAAQGQLLGRHLLGLSGDETLVEQKSGPERKAEPEERQNELRAMGLHRQVPPS